MEYSEVNNTKSPKWEFSASALVSIRCGFDTPEQGNEYLNKLVANNVVIYSTNFDEKYPNIDIVIRESDVFVAGNLLGIYNGE